MKPSLTFAIADVHGCAAKLACLHRFIDTFSSEKNRDAEIIYLGDLIDRGPNSNLVLDMVSERVNGGSHILIKGNHENWMYKSVVESCDSSIYNWLANGGDATLNSYGRSDFDDAIFFVGRKRPHHIQLIEGALPYYQRDNICFTHAGLRPGVQLNRQTNRDLMWIDNDFLDYQGHLDHIVVHGHTIVGERPVVTENRISLDTGAYANGSLTCMAVDWLNREIHFFQATDDNVHEVEPVYLDRGHGLATDFLFRSETTKIAA